MLGLWIFIVQGNALSWTKGISVSKKDFYPPTITNITTMIPSIEKSNKQIRIEEIQRYKKFTSERGSLFENTLELMNAEDILVVEKSNQFTRRITFPIVSVLVLVALLWSLYLFYKKEWWMAVSLFGSSAAAFFFIRNLASHYTELLETNQKQVIKGIVSDKRKRGMWPDVSYWLTISGKHELVVERTEFNKFHIGDIVRHESLGGDRPLKSTLTCIGNIKETEH